MPGDPAWDIVPVADPALRDGQRRRPIRGALTHDPAGLAEPLYQLRHRDQVVLASALDRVSRELLIRAQTAISSALDSLTDDALERCTAEVLATRSACQDLQDALRISNLNDSYLGLVARTAADEHAIAEISGLTDQATGAAQAVRDSMRQVGLAAAALALPEPAAS
jgi:hypothetical protein